MRAEGFPFRRQSPCSARCLTSSVSTDGWSSKWMGASAQDRQSGARLRSRQGGDAVSWVQRPAVHERRREHSLDGVVELINQTLVERSSGTSRRPCGGEEATLPRLDHSPPPLRTSRSPSPQGEGEGARSGLDVPAQGARELGDRALLLALWRRVGDASMVETVRAFLGRAAAAEGEVVARRIADRPLAHVGRQRQHRGGARQLDERRGARACRRVCGRDLLAVGARGAGVEIGRGGRGALNAVRLGCEGAALPESPKRCTLPITALRVTPPNCLAIWLAERPSSQSFFRVSTRSSVQPMARFSRPSRKAPVRSPRTKAQDVVAPPASRDAGLPHIVTKR